MTFKMIGREASPTVIVDGETATDNKLNDFVDEYDPTMKADRMIVNELVTTIGLSATRRMMAFSQQYHDNYFIYEYVFKNTGIVDLKGTKISKTLTGLYFHFQYRYAAADEPFKGGWAPVNSVNWGRNCVNQVIGTNPSAAGFEFRAQYSWYGKNSSSTVDDIGAPFYPAGDGHLGSVQYVGTVTLHADKSATDKSDDLTQPKTTMYIGSDTGPQINNQFDPQQMTRKYQTMSAGHAARTHADQIGSGFADRFGDDNGGYAQGQGFGPYTLAPGDSIRIVIAEGVAGINREMAYEVGRRWLQGVGPFTLPGGGTTNNKDAYKNAWVGTGEDSLKQTFRRAIQNFKSSYAIPQPPPAPRTFEVISGGDRIKLKWASNATSHAKFDGYEVYRAIGKPDTFYTRVFDCRKANAAHEWDDLTAQRGFDYYYYVVSKDDGTSNTIQPGVPLRSSKFYTMTNKPAYLRRPAKADLDSVRIVPNPFNVRAAQLAFGVTSPDRIAFFGLPGQCTIKIFTERGDLIKTIEHIDGSADELWDSLTESRQVIVSGVYIAVFQTPDGRSAIRKFVVIR